MQNFVTRVHAANTAFIRLAKFDHRIDFQAIIAGRYAPEIPNILQEMVNIIHSQYSRADQIWDCIGIVNQRLDGSSHEPLMPHMVLLLAYSALLRCNDKQSDMRKKYLLALNLAQVHRYAISLHLTLYGMHVDFDMPVNDIRQRVLQRISCAFVSNISTRAYLAETTGMNTSTHPIPWRELCDFTQWVFNKRNEIGVTGDEFVMGTLGRHMFMSKLKYPDFENWPTYVVYTAIERVTCENGGRFIPIYAEDQKKKRKIDTSVASCGSDGTITE